jgi:hypothetical protein
MVFIQEIRETELSSEGDSEYNFFLIRFIIFCGVPLMNRLKKNKVLEENWHSKCKV